MRKSKKDHDGVKVSWGSLQELYDDIPKMECIEGCSDCCGPRSWSKEEWDKIPEEQKKYSKLGFDCPYVQNGGCEVYDKRPFICRLRGTCPEDERLRCPCGRKPEMPLSKEQADVMIKFYIENYLIK